jgi:RNA polymerase sigma-70 factor, ECF subfamily
MAAASDDEPGRPDRLRERELSDRDLLTRHVDGDADAFGLLFTRHRDRLWAVALRTLGDPEQAADALQEAMISAFRRAGSYRGDAAVTTWLHRIVVNACLDQVRRNRVRSADPLPDDLDDARTQIAAPPRLDPAEQLSERTAVLNALRRLPRDQRHALVLVDMEGYSVVEAAELLGCAVGTVKSRCARGRARLLPMLAWLRNPQAQGDVTPTQAPAVDASGPKTRTGPWTGPRTGPGTRPRPSRGGD